ncbi:MAG: hypothetical protein LBV33_04185 [Lachnospiraceae bacterium]|jgi:ABC-2 type transport system permease protein|nr:hypothetical protein [Lachnospiraceae bacterium]
MVIKMIANFGKYFRFILKREGFMSSIWVVSLTAFSAIIVAMYPGLFPTAEAMQGLVATMNTPAMIALMGPVYGIEVASPAMVMAQECLIWLAIAVIIMNIFVVNRHTRADEELGRFEMLASLPVGRLANSAATIAFSFLLNLVVAVLIAVFLIIIPIEGATITGALVYGLSIGMQGMVFAAVTLLAAQLFSTARGSMGVSFAVMGVAYALRAQGDVADNVLSYISPMGLGLKVEAFYSNDFLPVGILMAEGVVLSLVALWVHSRRDIGAGIFPARKGRAHASIALRGPLGWAVRMMRGSFIVWSIGIFALGATYGAVIGELDNFVENNEMISQMLMAAGGMSMVDAFIAMLNPIMALIITVPLINCIQRLHLEEKRGRLESILSAAVPRIKLYGSFTLIAVIEAVVFTCLGALGLYVTAEATGTVELTVLLQASLVYLPAIFCMIGLAALLVGWRPKLSLAVWVVACYAFLMFYFGRIFTDIPEWVRKLSPFSNTPELPVQEFTATPLIVMCIIAIALWLVGLLGYRHRDLGR